MAEQLQITVADSSQIGEVRRSAVRLAQAANLTEIQQAEIGIVATELATNVLRHAKQGRILLQSWKQDDLNQVEILSIDSGPGMEDIGRCLQDGYSTAGTAGNGLGAVRRLAREFDVYSRPGGGAVLMARMGPAAQAGNRLSMGAISIPAPGESLCGDSWSFCGNTEDFSLVMVDGLGHGPAAHDVAVRAVQTFTSTASRPPAQCLSHIHRALQGSRGAAIAVTRVDCQQNTIQHAGVGNISAMVVAPGTARGLVSQNGILGVHNHRIAELNQPWQEPALLIMHSDGLQSRWRLDDYPGLMNRHPAVIAGILYRDFQRGRDDATVLVVPLKTGGTRP